MNQNILSQSFEQYVKSLYIELKIRFFIRIGLINFRFTFSRICYCYFIMRKSFFNIQYSYFYVLIKMNNQSNFLNLLPCRQDEDSLSLKFIPLLSEGNVNNKLTCLIKSSDHYYEQYDFDFFRNPEIMEQPTIVIDQNIEDIQEDLAFDFYPNILQQHKFKAERCVSMNISKFILRVFMTYFPTENNVLGSNITVAKRVKAKIRILKKQLKQKYNSFTYLHNLEILLSLPKSQQQAKINRNAMKNILRKKIHKQLKNNNRIRAKMRKLYLLISKVYALRCNNKQLAARIKHR